MQNKIAETRRAKRISQECLASIVGISRPYLSDIENGKYNLGGAIMLKIAKALGEKVEDIFFEDDVMHAEQGESQAV